MDERFSGDLVENEFKSFEEGESRSEEDRYGYEIPGSPLVLFSLMKSNHFPQNITVTVFHTSPDSRQG